MKSPKFRFRHFHNNNNKHERGMALYVEGWKEVIANKFHAPVERCNLSLKDHYVIILQDVTRGETDIGIVAFFKNSMVPEEAVVNMFYIKPEYRGKDLGKKLFYCFRKRCRDLEFSRMSFTVHAQNKAMRSVMYQAGGKSTFATYDFNLKRLYQQNLF